MADDVLERLLSPASRRQLQALAADRDDVLVTIHRPDGVVVYASGPALDAFAGADPSEVVGRNTFDRYHPDDRDRVRRAFRRAVETNETVSVSYRFPHTGGGWVRMRSVGWANPGPEGPTIVAVTVLADD